ncbi:hypothetical protein BIV24_16810 [Streptomyces colonosanans]|uniref:Uncharacterized protein n=2 Tax=Streptomyces colonosanans TaxID=1428652 RepID=A0A1S2PC02_9ACTN|nr:hypothetical protein BIV24_16810 [Streptomyces colonosanans]
MAALVVTVVALAGAAAPARAAGEKAPDLALVVANGTGRTTTLHSGDRDFTLLSQLLGPTKTGSERVPDAWHQGRYPHVRATVVWALTGIGGYPQTQRAPGGDVAIEREDQVFLAEDGTAWVRSDLAPDVDDDDIRWRRVPRAVYDRLEKSGLFGQPAAGDKGAPSDHLRWGAMGLGAGLVLGAGGAYAVRRAAALRGGAPSEPRQELLEL